MSPEQFAALAGGALAFLGVLGVLIRVAVKIDRVERLAGELAPNGGGSIKDTVHRIDVTLGTVVDKQAEHETRISRTEGRVDELGRLKG